MKRRKKQVGSTIGGVIDLAMRLSQPYLADYGATRSRHDFTQRQLMTCLVLRAYLKTTYRGVLDVLAESASLRERMGLTDKLPHFTTLQKFSQRSQVTAIAQQLIGRIGQAAAQQEASPKAVAMDATGMATSVASEYFRNRTGSKCTQWVKISVMVLCGSLLPVSAVLSLGPSNDRTQVPELLRQAQTVAQPQTLYADGGYDAEWIHAHCREQWGVESIIKPLNHRPDGTRSGKWRALMSQEHLRERKYGRRWAVESFFSGLKRTMGSALGARRTDQMIAEATFRVLAYALRR
jgi:Transposase DDE domain./Transposase domain (DUF772).